ncbi:MULTISPECIES: SDR family NAD(P)-dependent oxidoreductase [Novosphingobium]|jgi:3-oxoacyl-[acyl-carrier protein] reductase|uniref:SDR family NAD(P)-dependent oxidoreductase n=1 Tax=Novosphingobium TaxID=165696 RepID=UPI0022F259FD|nr:SDR family NAD(P)-dependent oxidoreductase [Novosphingobium resinovorum]GLK44704.1 3-oxoacyl-ACP reductase [Novosphingobium resinovorum]
MNEARVAVVTGAAQGIGRAVAERLAQTGHRLALLDVKGLDAVADALPGSLALRCDVADPASVEDCVGRIAAEWGHVDVLVNNAGISPSHGGRSLPVEETDIDEWHRVIAVNLTGTFLMCRAVLPVMKPRGWGRIVNFSSQGGRMRSRLSGAHYGATKAGVIGFTRVLAGQVGAHGITANCIAPGRIVTPQSEGFGDKGTYTDDIPVGRLGETDDIVAGVEYLISERAAFVSGTVLDVNGGFFMP